MNDSAADLSKLSLDDYSRLFRSSVDRYESVIGTRNPDLTDFNKAGGKMISWHGTADASIPYQGTIDYYDRLVSFDATAAEYYRLFLAPGVGHCSAGTGWYPGAAFEALVSWVEDGVAPETLHARSIGADGSDRVREVNLCRYPAALTYVDGEPALESSFICN